MFILFYNMQENEQDMLHCKTLYNSTSSKLKRNFPPLTINAE